jgi:hypothetical protein
MKCLGVARGNTSVGVSPKTFLLLLHNPLSEIREMSEVRLRMQKLYLLSGNSRDEVEY